MTIFDDIRKDREIGTPGPWITQSPGDAIYHKVDPPFGMKMHIAVCVAANNTPFVDGCRIARVPKLEEIALAADRLADALEKYNRSGAGPLDGWQDVQDALTAFRKSAGGE